MDLKSDIQTRLSAKPFRSRSATTATSGVNARVSFRSRLQRLCWWNFMLLVALWVFEQFVAEHFRWTTIVTYAPQHLWIFPTLCLLIACGWKRRPKLLAFNASVTLLFVVFFLGFNVPLSRWMPQAEAEATSSTRLRVMTFNIVGGLIGVDNVAQVVREQKPDVLCLQETMGLTTGRPGALQQQADPLPALQALLPKNWFMARTHEVTTFSRFPIVSQRVHEMPLATGRAILETQVNVRGKMLSVFNVHISMVELSPAEKQRDRAMPRVLQFGGSSTTRQKQIDVLLAATAKVRTPLVVCGDFNLPPRGTVYRNLSSKLTDSFRVAGWGSGFSFRADMPLMRIDYIWLSDRVRVLDCQVLNVRASDHRPYVADVEVR
ncbi:MAG TPA: endonuclease/exonuclease/phosphatase family protein [Abditibacteriaceae bacterium]|nr:endonuclease/exonuclease/phosphatase family protein [Abditibacteriaceae bacterium]